MSAGTLSVLVFVAVVMLSGLLSVMLPMSREHELPIARSPPVTADAMPLEGATAAHVLALLANTPLP